MFDWWIMFNPDGDPGGSSGEDTDPDSSQGDNDDPEGQEREDASSGASELVPRSELAKVNREAGRYRRQLRDMEAKVQELEGASKTELERAVDQKDAAEKALQDALKVNSGLRVRLLAEEVGIVKEARQDAARLLDWDSIEDPSSDEEVAEALKSLVKDRPYLLNVGGGADGGAGTDRGAGSTDMNQMIRSASGR